MKSKTLPLLLTTAIAVGAIVYFSSSPVAVASGEGAEAPAWTLNDVDGNPVSSVDFKGKVVVVDFWATWCPPCREEIPGYIEMQKKYGARGLVIVGISLDAKGPAVVKAFMEKYGINYTVVMGDGKVDGDFGGVEAIPTTFVIGRDGRIAFSKVGYQATEEFEKRLLPLL